ncbi:bifunctional diaminohydroxyphosphoribosylaminopyrimidine deaminase/5-amino-6-(5-phosphoribosylamino)uracil reductase RibD [Streptomyces sp. SID4985]|uniref:bifunctional diaminohydroxyphosphoribosylaminopyrimidine deaminase/5-amino-6-(5-phosphoribosylamino)uracil reductase RibD n=1 Tax=Streptomyces sp. SID4985 TaxID=2690292 RepID=UPI001370E96A|nr:bifunctional diaminohydroxyphosphoribosylaminopyrimidine deaminase/5-amino-6-(5-phosphoribosylamino)uracil reductase RibD [Streptomyces sp. SID4985]
MRRAIAVSAQGLGSTSPNPPVGCVVLDRGGRIVGEGYHVRKGESHAEVNALKAAGERAAGGTAVVTLEPCNHYGRTPPCREALIDAGVARVLIAVMDPTSRGEGGAALLRAAGVDVEQGVLADEALLVLGPWLASLTRGRPFVTWVCQAGEGERQAPVSDEVRRLRQSYDVVVRAGGEVEEGNPGRHGDGVFRVPRLSSGAGGDEVLKVLDGVGVRSVLVEGAAAGSPLAALADQVICYLPPTPDNASYTQPGRAPVALPAGYRLTDVSRHAEFVRLVGRRGL